MTKSERVLTSFGRLLASPRAGMMSSGTKPSANSRMVRRTIRTKSPKRSSSDGTATAEREVAMRCPLKFLALVSGAIVMSDGSHAASLGEFNPKNRVLVISAPAGDAAAEEQRRIYRSEAVGMAERDIILAAAEDNSERSRQIRSRVSADGKHFQVFLVGKDGHTALSSEKPLTADYLFGKIDAMPMRRDEMRRAR
jgi:hypothetical protein